MHEISTTTNRLRHKDAFGRLEDVVAGREHFLRPSDGRLVQLRVQNTGQLSYPGNANWDRTGWPKMRISLILRFTHWIYSSLLQEGGKKRDRNVVQTIWMVLKWVPSCLVLIVLVSRNCEASQIETQS